MASKVARPKRPPFVRIAFGLLAIMLLIGYLSDRVYYNRYASLFWSFATTGAQLETYDPLEALPGNPAAAPLMQVPEGQGGIAPVALAKATDYAKANNSSAFLVWHKGALVSAYYRDSSDRTTPIISRSLAKPFMAVAIGRALALGKIKSLDQPVADFLTQWKSDPLRSKILVRHLLDNRTGLLAQNPVFSPFEIRNRSYLHPHHEDILLKTYPILHVPGSRYDYSQANGDLVALVIERATGRRYAEFLSTEVLKPIGAQGGSIWINRPNGIAHSGCCMLLPPEDILRLGILLLQDGKWDGQTLLPAGYVAEMQKATPQNEHAGLSVYIGGRYVKRRGFANPDGAFRDTMTLHSEPYLAKDLFLFDGNAHQVVYIIPSTQTVILRTGKKPPKVPEFDNTILPNIILRGIVRRQGEPVPEPQPRS